jgi:hypothetical protein
MLDVLRGINGLDHDGEILSEAFDVRGVHEAVVPEARAPFSTVVPARPSVRSNSMTCWYRGL